MIGAWDDQCITLQDINIINETLHTKVIANGNWYYASALESMGAKL